MLINVSENRMKNTKQQTLPYFCLGKPDTVFYRGWGGGAKFGSTKGKTSQLDAGQKLHTHSKVFAHNIFIL